MFVEEWTNGWKKRKKGKLDKEWWMEKQRNKDVLGCLFWIEYSYNATCKIYSLYFRR